VLSSSQKFTFSGADSSPLDSSLLQEITKLGPVSSRGVRLEEREQDFYLAATPEPEPERLSWRLQALSARSLAERSQHALASGAVSAAEGIALASGLRLAEEGIRRIALASGLRLAEEGIRRNALALGASSSAEQNLPRASRTCLRACSERLQLSSSNLIAGSGGSGMRRREDTAGWRVRRVTIFSLFSLFCKL
jgi:hypothetical protein